MTISRSAADGGEQPSGVGVAVGQRSTPWRCPALWQGCTGRGATPPSYRRRWLPRVRQRSCTARTWRRRVLCMLDRVEGYRERSSPAGGWRRVSSNAGDSGVVAVRGEWHCDVCQLLLDSGVRVRPRPGAGGVRRLGLSLRDQPRAYTTICQGDCRNECKLMYS